MSGYRNKAEIYGDDDDPVQRSVWLKKVLAFCGYGVALIWLWAETDYPNSFGIDSGSGKGGALLNWYYSYLLLQRHALLDVITFIIMWLPVVGFIVWLALELRKDRQAKQASAARLNPISNSDAE